MYFVSWSRLDSSAPSSHPSFVGDVFTWNLFEFSSSGLSSQVNVIDISQKNLIKRIWAIGNHEFQVDWLLAPLKWLLKEGGQQVERMISRDRTVLSPDPALQRYDYQSWIKAPLPRQSPAHQQHIKADWVPRRISLTILGVCGGSRWVTGLLSWGWGNCD